MKKFLSTLLLLCSFSFVIEAAENAVGKFTEGNHYQILPLEASKNPVVTEYFSFFCGHCYNFEPVMDNLKKGLNPGVAFEKSHVDFMPRGRKDIADLYSKALFVANTLNVQDKIIPKIFESIHVKKQVMDSEEKVMALFASVGVAQDTFKGAFSGFIANGAVGDMKAAQQRVQLSSVPTVVVNGKYKVVPNNVKSEAEYIELVNYLSTLN